MDEKRGKLARKAQSKTNYRIGAKSLQTASVAIIFTIAILGCGRSMEGVPGKAVTVTPTQGTPNQLLPVDSSIVSPAPQPLKESQYARTSQHNAQRNAYFGDLHVHTAYSFDAFTFGTTATPSDAYRYALGETIKHPSGYDLTLKRPLDFYAVTDHASFLGVAREAADINSAFSQEELSQPLHNLNADDNKGLNTVATRGRLFGSFVKKMLAALNEGSINSDILTDITRRTWRDTAEAADTFYTPGTFTTFLAYEYTSRTSDRGNLHRNVVFRNTSKIPGAPFSRMNSQNPEGLWDWMDGLRAQGIESLAIPHNSNASNGQMFKMSDWAGNPINDIYALQRLRNEPLVEVTQIKGTSETHPLLSDNDEWANFEIAPFRISTRAPSSPPGGYVRDAYLRGMKLQADGVINPYKFGLIGSSDTHVAASSDREDNFFSKSGLMDGEALKRGSVPLPFFSGIAAKIIAPGILKKVGERNYIETSAFETWGASGLAGVWAEENTREAIYSALRRKETFATSGPRIQVRVFAGYNFGQEILQATDMIEQAYASGVSMGSDLAVRADETPQLLIWAAQDGDSAPLQRLQVIKGYVVNGKAVEKVFDVACSDNVQLDPLTHRCADNGASVDIDTCAISADSGAAQLLTLWKDPEFDPQREAFYYVRVLENPTCRWSTWDAVRAGVKPREDLPITIQERAWSSPIWYTLEQDQ